MGLELELYFNPEDLATLVAKKPKNFFVTVKTQFNQDGNAMNVVVYATGYNEKGEPVGNPVPGCPSPCRPFEFDKNCEQKAQLVLSNYESSDFL